MTTPELAAINPDIHERYSPNLYRWLKKNHSRYEKYEVWRRQGEGNYTGLYVGYVHAAPFDKDFVGMRMNAILCRIRGTSSSVCYSGMAPEMVKDESFWPLYQSIGRCAIDPEHAQHFLNAKNRFSIAPDGKARVCNWCGHEQVLRQWKEVIQREKWENV